MKRRSIVSIVQRYKSSLIDSFTNRIRCKPGDHFSSETTLHIPDFFEKVNNDSNKRTIHKSSVNKELIEKSILYEDSHMIVVNKPPGMCCQVSI